VIQTTQRRMITAYRNTPVVYRGETYRVSNLEVGDHPRRSGTRARQRMATRECGPQSIQGVGTLSRAAA
jgi:hypothetical protein